jgi:hypothetical protein
MKSIHINDLPRADQLDQTDMANIHGGEDKGATLPKEKPIKLTYDHGTIIGTWANGTVMPIPL